MGEDTFRWAIMGCVAISTLCILTMAVVAVVVYRILSQVKTRVDGLVARVHPIIERAQPIVETARRVADENAPKISSIISSTVEVASNAKDISYVAKDEAHRYAELSRDFADRAKAKVERVDHAMDETVDHMQHAGENVKTAVMKPVKVASGVLAGVKATVSSLTNGRHPSIDHITQDEEMFI